jgi:hypothetical protein
LQGKHSFYVVKRIWAGHFVVIAKLITKLGVDALQSFAGSNATESAPRAASKTSTIGGRACTRYPL